MLEKRCKYSDIAQSSKPKPPGMEKGTNQSTREKGPDGAPNTPTSADVTDHDQGQGQGATRRLMYGVLTRLCSDKLAWIDHFSRYVHDPDQWNIFALINSATYYRAAGLRVAVYRHFASRTSIEVSSSVRLFPPCLEPLSINAT